jgi:hypothetical protein
MDELIQAYEEYIKLLGDEISELVSFAEAHGWRSSRHQDGVKCREKIDLLKRSYKVNKKN